MFESLLNNQFLTGGAIIGIGAALKDKPKQLVYRLREEFLTTLTMEDNCDPLLGMKDWVVERLSTKRTRQLFRGGAMRVAPGTYWAGFYHKTPLWINFSRVEAKSSHYGNEPLYRDTFTLTFLTRNHQILDDFVQEMTEIYQNKAKKDTFKVYFNCNFLP